MGPYQGYLKVRMGSVVEVYQWWRTINPSPLRATSVCRVCDGTGMADQHNECGYCDAEVQ